MWPRLEMGATVAFPPPLQAQMKMLLFWAGQAPDTSSLPPCLSPPHQDPGVMAAPLLSHPRGLSPRPLGQAKVAPQGLFLPWVPPDPPCSPCPLLSLQAWVSTLKDSQDAWGPLEGNQL